MTGVQGNPQIGEHWAPPSWEGGVAEHQCFRSAQNGGRVAHNNFDVSQSVSDVAYINYAPAVLMHV